MRNHAMQIFEAALNAVRPKNLIPNYIQVEDNNLCIGGVVYGYKELDHIYIVAAGKAAGAMALEAEIILENIISACIVVTKYGHSISLKGDIIECGHPVPDDQSLMAGNKVLELLHKAGSKDLVILLLSGGSSSLIESLPAGISLNDLQVLSGLMLRNGLTIKEMNTIRKHLSGIKGGRFSAAAYPAKIHTLILSDVPGDELSDIASGLTAADPTTFEDAYLILEKFNLVYQCPDTILRHLKNGIKRRVTETPKTGDEVFKFTTNQIIGSNRIALHAAMAEAAKLGYHPVVINSDLTGEASKQAVIFVNHLNKYSGPRPACLLMGGETTVTLKGNGSGGRNQEFALAALIALQDLEENKPGSVNSETLTFQVPTILSAGTDGSDGPTEATGAIIDAQTLQSVQDQNINARHFIIQNDSYNFFNIVGGHIITGPTQTNVMDIVIGLISS